MIGFSSEHVYKKYQEKSNFCLKLKDNIPNGKNWKWKSQKTEQTILLEKNYLPDLVELMKLKIEHVENWPNWNISQKLKVKSLSDIVWNKTLIARTNNSIEKNILIWLTTVNEFQLKHDYQNIDWSQILSKT